MTGHGLISCFTGIPIAVKESEKHMRARAGIAGNGDDQPMVHWNRLALRCKGGPKSIIRPPRFLF